MAKAESHCLLHVEKIAALLFSRPEWAGCCVQNAFQKLNLFVLIKFFCGFETWSHGQIILFPFTNPKTTSNF